MYTPLDVKDALEKLNAITGRSDLIVLIRQHINFLNMENESLTRELDWNPMYLIHRFLRFIRRRKGK